MEWVKEHEDYNSELQEVEKWLLQMSSRLVTSDSMQTSSMEMATQQLARHKVTTCVTFLQKCTTIQTNYFFEICIILISDHSLSGNNGGDSQF